MTTLGLKDKNDQELFAGDTVQIVNGANAGKKLYKIRASSKSWTVEGSLSEKSDDQGVLKISCKKIIRLTKSI